MNALRTEDDLRDALDELSAGAPSVDAVLPRVDRPRRRLAWIAPLAAALLVLAVVAVMAIDRAPDRSPAAGSPPSHLIGEWRLVSVGSWVVRRGDAMWITARGKFWTNLPPCDSIGGDVEIAGSTWQLRSPTTVFGSCPALPPTTHPHAEREVAIANGLRHMFTRTEITWSLTVDRLALRRPGVPTLVYVRVQRR